MHLIGIRREDKNLFERRVPLTPRAVELLGSQDKVQVVVQPAPRRIFEDQAFVDAGAKVVEGLQACPIIMGVKEIPISRLKSGKTYVYFSHTIKGQTQNMPMLRRLMELGCNLIDYERIVDDDGRRLVFFGEHAGLAGMIDSLWALGKRLSSEEGLDTPFLDIRQASEYDSLRQAKEQIREVARRLKQEGIPAAVAPLIVGITGYGHVSNGAQEILDLFDPRTITPEEVVDLPATSDGLFKVVFREEHLVEPLEGSFDLQEYYQRPDRYRSVFDRHLPRLTVLVNCIYWEPKYPRLVTLEQLGELYDDGQPALRVIGDITCDINGSVEATVKATDSENPVFVYDLKRNVVIDGVTGPGPVIMSVDILPAELPREASESFSAALMPFIPGLAAARYREPLEKSGLPAPLQKAMIVYQGALTEPFQYLTRYL